MIQYTLIQGHKLCVRQKIFTSSTFRGGGKKNKKTLKSSTFRGVGGNQMKMHSYRFIHYQLTHYIMFRNLLTFTWSSPKGQCKLCQELSPLSEFKCKYILLYNKFVHHCSSFYLISHVYSLNTNIISE